MEKNSKNNLNEKTIMLIKRCNAIKAIMMDKERSMIESFIAGCADPSDPWWLFYIARKTCEKISGKASSHGNYCHKCKYKEFITYPSELMKIPEVIRTTNHPLLQVCF